MDALLAMAERGKLEADHDQVTNLLAFYGSRTPGTNMVPVTYNLSNSVPGKLDFGRLYGNLSHWDLRFGYIFGTKGSLETLPRRIRGVLCDSIYWDLDFKNCHPVILVQMMEQAKFRGPFLKLYATKREEFFDYMWAVHGRKREQLKTDVIRCIFGGMPTAAAGGLIMGIYKEVRKFIENLKKDPAYAALLPHARGQPNPNGSFLSFILQTHERTAMLAMREFLEKAGRSVDVLAYDGVMIRKLDGETECLARLLTDCEAAVAAETSWRLELQVKPMESMALDEH